MNKLNTVLTKKEYEAMQQEYIAYWTAKRDAVISEYSEFIESIKKYTEIIVGTIACQEDLKEDIVYDIVGPEFRLDKHCKNGKKSIYVPFTDEVVDKVYEECPRGELLEKSSWLYKYDYSTANIKLGCIIHEGISASQLLDLDYFMRLLNANDIPSYIDNEKQQFHINAYVPEELPKYLTFTKQELH